jgi:SulP family sulfate permease
MLERGGQLEHIGRDHVFGAKGGAIARVFDRLDHDICRRCTARIFVECAKVPPLADSVQPPARAARPG